MCSVYGEQMATLLICFAATHSNQGFLKALMLPTFSCYIEKRSAIRPQTIWQHKLPRTYSILEMRCHDTQTFPILRLLQLPDCAYSSIWGGRVEEAQFCSVEEHVLSVRKHMLPFFPHDSFFLLWAKGQRTRETSSDLLHTQWWLSAQQWVTEIDMFSQCLPHIHLSQQSHLGRLVLPWMPYAWSESTVAASHESRWEHQPCSQQVSAENNKVFPREKHETNKQSCFLTNMAFLQQIMNTQWPLHKSLICLQQPK